MFTPGLVRRSDMRRAREQSASESMLARECRRTASAVGVSLGIGTAELGEVEEVDVSIVSPAGSAFRVSKEVSGRTSEEAHVRLNRTTSSSTSSSQRLSLRPSDARMRMSFA